MTKPSDSRRPPRRQGAVILYLHIPKVGGTTLTDCMYAEYCRDEPYEAEMDPETGKNMFYDGIYHYAGGFFKDPDLTVPNHARRALARPDLRVAVGHFWFGLHEHVVGDWIYATMLRDPVERIVSLHAHLTHYGVPRPLPREGMTLHEFVVEAPFREVDNDQTRRIAGEEPPVGGCSRALLERAKENLRRYFGVVGVTERFDETLVLFSSAFGWQNGLRYFPRNKARSRPAVAAVAEETLSAIRSRNELDLELHRFAGELLDEALAARGEQFREQVAAFRAAQEAWLAERPLVWAQRREAARRAREGQSGPG